ncbi:MAG: hypothetical protein ACLFQQ_21235, partial [Desulfococcaceae bacterium]
MKSFRSEPSAIVGSLILLGFAFAAVFASVIAPMDPYDLTTVELGNYL